ncbi:uncharacterized protein LOC128166221 [Crassostrea angulata]|uniref:uncharacterized protein LOC128166221 n=1 Tax=Magallana angulata TaxID=2784310 RepID=UPI0022B0DA9F|nr:uncharacterized protein LOC128166221 [Crassostrea angulata]
MEASKILLTGFVLIICAFICQLIGLASPYWISFENLGMKEHIGLWKFCAKVKSLDKDECAHHDWEIIPDWLKAVRATSSLGFLTLLVALEMTILKLFFLKDMKPALFAAIGTAFMGALFILISLAVFVAKTADLISHSGYKYHFAFVFCILAMLAAVGSGSVMVVDAVRSKTI